MLERIKYIFRCAVQLISTLSDEELCLYIMPLVQALKHENNYDSVLARFLLYRSFRSPVIVGHTFFWTLKVIIKIYYRVNYIHHLIVFIKY